MSIWADNGNTWQNFLLFTTNRSDVAWMILDEALAEFNYEVSRVKLEGFSFLSVLQQCLKRDHGMNISLKDIKQLLDSEVYKNNYVYKPWYVGSTKEMLAALDNYLSEGKWVQSIVDRAVFAAVKCLQINLCIFKNINGHALLYLVYTDPLWGKIYIWSLIKSTTTQ